MAAIKRAGKKLSVKKQAPAQGTGPEKKNSALMLVLAALAVFVLFEVNFSVQKAVRQNKRPDFIAAFPKVWQGLTSMAQYGNSLYIVDNTAGVVLRTGKQDGKLINRFQLAEGVITAVEDSKGQVYILDRQNTIHVFTPDNKPEKVIKLAGMSTLTWLEVDSKDGFYAADWQRGVITKYDDKFNQISSFGGKGHGKNDFTSLSKIYAGPDNRLYCIDNIETFYAHIKVLDLNGRFLKEWPIRNMKKFTMLENLAVTPDGHVYINSFEGSSVFVFDWKGKFLSKFDTDKEKKFTITAPSSMTGGKDGRLYVASLEIGVFTPVKY